jgi:hypothetical protein
MVTASLSIGPDEVYRLEWDHSFRPLTASEESVQRLVRLGLARGNALSQAWEPIAVRRNHDVEFDGLPNGDFPLLLPGIVIFRAEMAASMAGHAPAARVLDLESGDGESLSILHVSHFADCLEVERSSFARSPRGGVSKIERAAFRRSQVDRSDAFWRIPQEPYNILILGSEPLMSELRSLRGLSLRLYGSVVD